MNTWASWVLIRELLIGRKGPVTCFIIFIPVPPTRSAPTVNSSTNKIAPFRTHAHTHTLARRRARHEIIIFYFEYTRFVHFFLIIYLILLSYYNKFISAIRAIIVISLRVISYNLLCDKKEKKIIHDIIRCISYSYDVGVENTTVSRKVIREN